ncbi:MAG: hypothetical protein OEV08_14505 [Nitrospira sp.]|nr:hypothetical protein [Nitrospira sp.]
MKIEKAAGTATHIGRRIAKERNDDRSARVFINVLTLAGWHIASGRFRVADDHDNNPDQSREEDEQYKQQKERG